MSVVFDAPIIDFSMQPIESAGIAEEITKSLLDKVSYYIENQEVGKVIDKYQMTFTFMHILTGVERIIISADRRHDEDEAFIDVKEPDVP